MLRYISLRLIARFLGFFFISTSRTYPSRSGWQVAFINNRTKKEWGGRRRPQEVSFFIARGNLIGQNRIRQACQSNLLSAYISDFPFTAALLRVSPRIRSQRAKRCGNTTTVNKHNPRWLIPSLHLSQNHSASCDSSTWAKQVLATQSDFPNKRSEQFQAFLAFLFVSSKQYTWILKEK